MKSNSLVIFYLLLILFSKNIHGAGNGIEFIIEIPKVASFNKNKIEPGRYKAVVVEKFLNRCAIEFFDLNKFQNEINSTNKKSKPILSIDAACLWEDKLVETYKIETFSKDNILLIYFETPDHEKNMTRYIIAKLRLSDD